jgi:hypothetical protein
MTSLEFELLLARARLINKREQIGRRGAPRKHRVASIGNAICRDADQAARLGDHITKIEGSPRIAWNSMHQAIMVARARAHGNPRRPLTRKAVQHALVGTDRHLVHESNYIDGNVV